MSFLRLEFPNSKQTIELPLEDDGSLLLTTLKSQFPDASGLTYYCKKASSTRGLRLCEGKFWPPQEGWLEPNIRTCKVISTKVEISTALGSMQIGGSSLHNSLEPGKATYFGVQGRRSSTSSIVEGLDSGQISRIRAKLERGKITQTSGTFGTKENCTTWNVNIGPFELMSILASACGAEIITCGGDHNYSSWTLKADRI